MMVSWDSFWHMTQELVKCRPPLTPSSFGCYINLIPSLARQLRNPPDSSRQLPQSLCDTKQLKSKAII